ncbi:DEAD/DEAH box helicase [Lachnospiraceae bacterium OttesenSCG-928-D06]|nr:DEAD/DEAH box helicase [Lachnospiraceae bacterium OttesenSCG-928-D06]
MQSSEAIFSNETNEWIQSTFGEATLVQKEAWPFIAAGHHVLVSAPTGTGKTLSAFLVFIDKLKEQSRKGQLKEELLLIYVSPLKSLAGDIRENLNRPLQGISAKEEQVEIRVGIRTGDTIPKDRQRMIKHPPHILIITPESLYLMLTSKKGQKILETAKAIIIDELHVMIDTKRGAHLMLSIARLDKLCGKPLQRIGLSATIEPLTLAAEYLSPDPVIIVAPKMEKKIRIQINGTMAMGGRRKRDPLWDNLAKAVYRQCLTKNSVIAFCEARRFAEKLAYYVNEISEEGFAKVHHGSLSKEQRLEVEEELRAGKLRLLCATSSMELGIDVGDIDLVLQIGCPRTISGTMQRLGRSGHNPNRVSVMEMYPRTPLESMFCGMTAEAARAGGVELAAPPKLCLDVLAQHLVSMSATATYDVSEVLPITKRTYSFSEITVEDLRDILCMLSGDYEHRQEIPVRPRLIYDRIHDRVSGDIYSRMLATAAGGTIPDKGMYHVKTKDGVKLGELDEEFVYESRLGESFLLGAFAWRIIGQDKDTVLVEQTGIEGAKLPFWKGELKGRSYQASLIFASKLEELNEAAKQGTLKERLAEMGLDREAQNSTADFITRQMQATGDLPAKKRIIVEHFKDQSGVHQLMVHAMYGRRVNAPLSLLMQQAAMRVCEAHVACVDEEDGFLLYPYDGQPMPERLLYEIKKENAREILEAILPGTPAFSMTFRYNAGRALMMGMKQNGRTPLWLQRIRSTQMMEYLLAYKNHPLIRETKRECLEELWDIEGLLLVLEGIECGDIEVREIWVNTPSPMSLPLQWQVEAAEMYSYAPTTEGIRKAVYEELSAVQMLQPSAKELELVSKRSKTPENEEELHRMLMMEGDFVAGEVSVPVLWLESLAKQGRTLYIEPGLWIAAEQEELYRDAFSGEADSLKSLKNIVRRMLYYRGGKQISEISLRYFIKEERVKTLLEELILEDGVVLDKGMEEGVEKNRYYHKKLYTKARNATIHQMRSQGKTQKPECYSALMARRLQPILAEGEELFVKVLEGYLGKVFPISLWEEVIFPGRIKNYRESMLDKLLSQGLFFWKAEKEGITFFSYEEVDYDKVQDREEIEKKLTTEEMILYKELQKRGASFLQALGKVAENFDPQEVLFQLAQKGLVYADSFGPARKLTAKKPHTDKEKKSHLKQRIQVRAKLLSDGRWDLIPDLKPLNREGMIKRLFLDNVILCRETFLKSLGEYDNSIKEELNWSRVLEVLRIWEYTGKVRRGYFISGMSGAQFVLSEEYERITLELERKTGICWINASDPLQMWGKTLPHKEGRNFINVPGTMVALFHGDVVAVMERQGKVLRVFDYQSFEEVMKAFVQGFQNKSIWPKQKRLIIKEYEKEGSEALKKAGFIKEMQDYVLYR